MVGFPAREKPFNHEKWPISSFSIGGKERNVSERYVLIFGTKKTEYSETFNGVLKKGAGVYYYGIHK